MAETDSIAFFPDLPKLDAVAGGGETWTVCECWASQLVEGRAVVIRSGMQTDGASVPRFFWRFIGHPLMQALLGHALPHDALYAAELMDRKACDDFFLMSMKLAGVPWWKRNAVWSAVRIGGGAVWKRHTPASVAAARQYARVVDGASYLHMKSTGRILPFAT